MSEKSFRVVLKLKTDISSFVWVNVQIKSERVTPFGGIYSEM